MVPLPPTASTPQRRSHPQWDVVGEGNLLVDVPHAHRSTVNMITTINRGLRFATCSNDGTIRLWCASLSRTLPLELSHTPFPCFFLLFFGGELSLSLFLSHIIIISLGLFSFSFLPCLLASLPPANSGLLCLAS